VYKRLGVTAPHTVDAKAAIERMIYAMVNEAAVILDEKIVGSAAELDLAMIMGTGFPPFRGGLLRYADSIGVAKIVSRLEALEKQYGSRFAPTAALRRMAASGAKFYA
jgi:3-hydroxyacyl-CoA dehydrogenase/enoyl-CoA hydratase/3-hydroxybutyryl-CoA epimerase